MNKMALFWTIIKIYKNKNKKSSLIIWMSYYSKYTTCLGEFNPKSSLLGLTTCWREIIYVNISKIVNDLVCDCFFGWLGIHLCVYGHLIIF